MALLIWVLVALAPPAHAVTHEGNGWRIRKWSDSTSVQCGEEVVYNIEVTRTGPDASEVNIVDGRDRGTTTGYTSVEPAPDFGGVGGHNNLVWLRTLQPGETFTARYGIQLMEDLTIGRRMRNWVMADPTSGDPHLSVDYDIWIGAGNETTQANPYTGEAGDPINTATGEFAMDPVTDIDLGGPLPLKFTRWYGSRLNDPGLDLVESALGVGWMHNFEVQAWKGGLYDWSMQVMTEGGKRVDFTQVYGPNGGWQLNREQETVPYEFKFDGESFWFLDPARERLYRFNPTVWSYAQEILDRNGNSLLIHRRPDHLVTNVTDGLGRSLDFEHTAENRLLRITDGIRSIGFAYDAWGTVIAMTNTLDHVIRYAYDPVYSHTNLQGALMTAMTG